MPGVFGIVGGDPRGRAARRDRMREAMTHRAQVAHSVDLETASLGVIVRESDAASPVAASGRWSVLVEGDDAVSLAAELATDGVTTLGGRDGWHTGVATDGRDVLLFSGFLGVEPLFFRHAGEELVFAPELKGILAVTDASLDPDACADAVRFDHPLGTDTFLAGVRTLRPGFRLRFGPEGLAEEEAPAPGAPCRPDEALDWLLAEWPGWVRRSADRPGRLAGFLTGGLDSRAVMAALPAAVPAITFGREGTLDVFLARRLAAGMGRRHVHLELPDDFLPRIAEDVVHRMDGTANLSHVPGAPTNDAIKELADHVTSGAFGDVVFGTRARYGSGLLATLALLPAAEALLPDAPPLAERTARHEREGMDARAYLFAHRVRRFYGPTIAERRHFTETLHPFYRRDFLSLFSSLAPEDRRDGALYQRFVRALAPALAQVPWSRTGVPLGAPVPSGVGLARRWDRGIDRLLRNLRLHGRRDPTRYQDVPYLYRANAANREFLLEHLAPGSVPWVDDAGVRRALAEHLSGKRDHSTLLGRLLALSLWVRGLRAGYARPR